MSRFGSRSSGYGAAYDVYKKKKAGLGSTTTTAATPPPTPNLDGLTPDHYESRGWNVDRSGGAPVVSREGARGDTWQEQRAAYAGRRKSWRKGIPTHSMGFTSRRQRRQQQMGAPPQGPPSTGSPPVDAPEPPPEPVPEPPEVDPGQAAEFGEDAASPSMAMSFAPDIIPIYRGGGGAPGRGGFANDGSPNFVALALLHNLFGTIR